jgi:hypothetical protein
MGLLIVISTSSPYKVSQSFKNYFFRVFIKKPDTLCLRNVIHNISVKENFTLTDDQMSDICKSSHGNIKRGIYSMAFTLRLIFVIKIDLKKKQIAITLLQNLCVTARLYPKSPENMELTNFERYSVVIADKLQARGSIKDFYDIKEINYNIINNGVDPNVLIKSVTDILIFEKPLSLVRGIVHCACNMVCIYHIILL